MSIPGVSSSLIPFALRHGVGAHPAPANRNAICLPAPKLFFQALEECLMVLNTPQKRSATTHHTDHPWADEDRKAFPDESSPPCPCCSGPLTLSEEHPEEGLVCPTQSEVCLCLHGMQPVETDHQAAQASPAEAAGLLWPSNPSQFGFSSVRCIY